MTGTLGDRRPWFRSSRTPKHRPRFSGLAKAVSHIAGHPVAFLAALGVVISWAVSGPVFKFSDTWQLVINTGTTVVTFLMVFLIQSSQNRDTMAMQLKLDELIRAVEGAHTVLLDLEELEESELRRIRENYCKLAADARRALREGRPDTSSPDVELPPARADDEARAR